MLTSRPRRPLFVYLLAAFQAPAAEPGREKRLLIGLIPEQGLFKRMERYEPPARSLIRTAGIEIQPVILPRHGNVVGNFPSAEMDGDSSAASPMLPARPWCSRRSARGD
jgi:hypothetical protein